MIDDNLIDLLSKLPFAMVFAYLYFMERKRSSELADRIQAIQQKCFDDLIEWLKDRTITTSDHDK